MFKKGGFFMRYKLKKIKKGLCLVGTATILCASNKLMNDNMQLVNKINELKQENDELLQANKDLESINNDLSKYETLMSNVSKEEYTKDELDLMLINDQHTGEPCYRFVYTVNVDLDYQNKIKVNNNFYRGVSDPSQIFPVKIYESYRENINEYISYSSIPQVYFNNTDYRFVPDADINYAIVDKNAFLKTDKYVYSKEELLELEAKINQVLNFNPDENKLYSKENLIVVKASNQTYICDISNRVRVIEPNYVWDVDTLELYDYCYGITNPINGVKLDLGYNYISFIEKTYESEEPLDLKYAYASDVVSLDPSCGFHKANFNIEAIDNVLPSELVNKEALTYQDIVNLENTLNENLSYSR